DIADVTSLLQYLTRLFNFRGLFQNSSSGFGTSSSIAAYIMIAYTVIIFGMILLIIFLLTSNRTINPMYRNAWGWICLFEEKMLLTPLFGFSLKLLLSDLFQDVFLSGAM